MARRTPLRTALAACLAVTAILTVAGATTGAAASSAAKPKWLVLQDFWPAGSGPEVVGSASGRGWLGFWRDEGGSRSTILGSLRRVGGKVSFAKTVLPASRGPMMIVGSQLFYHLPDPPSGNYFELRSAPLLSNGRVGTPRAVPEDPERVPPQEFDPVVVDGIQVGDRIVWVLSGAKMNERGGIAKAYLWACCSANGELSNLTRFLKKVRMVPGRTAPRLGLDSKGRLWLAAWLESSRGVPEPQLLELDPETLAPRTPGLATLPGVAGSVQRAELSCDAFCRVVTSESPSGDILVYSPGGRSPVTMVSGTRTSPADLLGVSDRSGNLVVASATTLQLDRPPWSVQEISIVRGDARGSHARRVGSVAPAPFGPTSPFQWAYPVHATFVPGGLVFFKLYYNFRDESQTRVLAGFLPLLR